MNVAFISHSAEMAGAERALINFIKYIDRNTITPICIFPNSDGPAKKNICDLNVPIIDLPYGFYIPGYSDNLNNEYVTFRRLFYDVRPDVVVVNTQVLFPAILAAKSLNIKVIFHSHGIVCKDLFPQLDVTKWLAIDALHVMLSDKVFVPAKFIKEIYTERYPELCDKIEVISNGTDLIKGDSSKSDVLEFPIFSMLCTIEENKGVETFILAASDYLNKYGDAKFKVYGYGCEYYVGKLTSMIDELNISHAVEILEKRKDVRYIYENSVSVIVASKIESFSLVAIEAMSYGCPVIATRCGGPEEIIDDGINGYLINVGDFHSLSARMNSISTDIHLRKRLSISALQKIEQNFDIKITSSRYNREIRSLISEDRENNFMVEHLLALVGYNLLSKEYVGNFYLNDNIVNDDYRVDDINHIAAIELFSKEKWRPFSYKTKCKLSDISYICCCFRCQLPMCVRHFEFEIYSPSSFKKITGVVGVEVVINNEIEFNTGYSISHVDDVTGTVRISVNSIVLPAFSIVEIRFFTKGTISPIYVKGERYIFGVFSPLVKIGHNHEV